MAEPDRATQGQIRGSRLRRVGRAVRVAHPAPSIIVSTGVAVLAAAGGATANEVAALALAMLGFQSSIGALNDIVDAETDALAATDKPIPSGAVSRRSAAAVAGLGAAVGIVISASFSPVVLALGMAGWGCGVAYDILLRRRGLGWLAFVGALPLLLAWTWSATMSFPTGWPALLMVAAVAGPMIHLANSLVDPETDERTGRRTLATALGVRRSRIALSLLVILVFALAALTGVLHGSIAAAQAAAFLLGTVLAAAGVALAWTSSPRGREAGWLLLAASLIPIVAAWVTLGA